MQIARIIGYVLVAIGVLGFIPGITSDSGMLLGIFEVDMVHNLVHLILGILVIALASNKSAVMAVGALYLILGLLGLFTSGAVLGFLTVNAADNWLHIVIGALLLWAGMKVAKPASTGTAM